MFSSLACEYQADCFSSSAQTLVSWKMLCSNFNTLSNIYIYLSLYSRTWIRSSHIFVICNVRMWLDKRSPNYNHLILPWGAVFIWEFTATNFDKTKYTIHSQQYHNSLYILFVRKSLVGSGEVLIKHGNFDVNLLTQAIFCHIILPCYC